MIMDKFLTCFTILVLLIITQSCDKQQITAELDYTQQKADSLTLLITLKNNSNKPFFLICKANDLEFDYNNAVLIDYNDPLEKQFENSKKDAKKFIYNNNEQSSMKDTILITLPMIRERYQVNHKGKKVDVFEKIYKLRESYYTLKRNSYVPTPPNMLDMPNIFYTDVDVYNLIKLKNIDDDETMFYQQAIILQPHETKTFFVDLSYLLLQKATYRFVFDFTTDDDIFEKQGEELKKVGFNRFKGKIMSDTLDIISDGKTLDLMISG